jgi:CubicO group peptidase (beta-lactamase class C family)
MPDATPCPPPHDLERFSAGLASDAEAGAIEEHLRGCPQCVAALGTLPAEDALLRALRRGGPATDPAEGAAVAGLIGRLKELPGLETTGAEAPTLPPQVPAGGPTPILYDFLAPPQGPDELGRLGHYRILSVLGAGGMGVVFQAEDTHLLRRVALKVMAPALAASAGARERFLLEARATAALEHDHIVAIYQVGEDRGVPYFAMQFLKGETLEERLRREGRLPTAEVLRVGAEIAEGLAAAHAHGLIHRDVKPANVWLEEGRGRVKLLDFGLVRAAGQGEGLTRPGSILGTPEYMAPEQGSGGATDHRTDLFSLGCVLYRLATGRPAFKGDDMVATIMAVATEDPPPPRALAPDLPAPLSDLVLRLLAKSPDDRPASAAAVAEALRALAAGDPGPARAQSRRAGRRGRRRLLLVSAALLLSLLLAAAWWFRPHAPLAPVGETNFALQADDAATARLLDRLGGVTARNLQTGHSYLLRVDERRPEERCVLPEGDYDLELPLPDTALVFSALHFTVRRGEPAAVKVTTLRPPPFAVTDFEVLLDATSDEAGAWVQRGRPAGFHQTFVSARTLAGQPRITTIGVQGDPADWRAWGDPNVQAYRERWHQQRAEGFREVMCATYRAGNQTCYESVWLKDGLPLWWSEAEMSEERYREELQRQRARGYRFLSAAVLRGPGGLSFQAIAAPDGGVEWEEHHGLTAEELQALLEGCRARRWRPDYVHAYEDRGGTRFLAILIENRDGTAWDWRLGLSRAECEQAIEARRGKSMRPLAIAGYSDSRGEARYTALWVVCTPRARSPRASIKTGPAVPELAAFDKAMQQFMAEREIPTGSLAVMKGGKLLLARGYGFADREQKRPVAPDAPFRLASVTKAVTNAAVQKLIREGKLRPGTKVAALLDLKPPTGRTMDARWQDVTVQHLLDHRGGWDRAAAFDPMFRPLEVAAALGKPGPASADDVVRYMAGQPLQFAPGSQRVYSNFGYCLLGRVIEKVTGRGYTDYVRAEVLAPAGVTGMGLGRTLPADRAPGEPFYSDPGRGPNVLRPGAVETVAAPDGTFYLEATDAHGGLIGSAVDVVRFLQAYSLDGRPRTAPPAAGCYFGQLPGTFTMALQRADGVQIAALFNQSRGPGCPYAKVRELLDKAADAVRTWPTKEVHLTK